MERLDHALMLASFGFRVFPLRPEANRPVLKGWQQAATVRMKQIERWFAGTDYNIGVACGELSNLTVIDIDAKGDKNGFATLAEFAGKGQTLPATPIVQTPHGAGRHLYFKFHPQLKNWVGKLGAGIDIKTEGGFVAGPGSIRDGAEYKWLVPPGRGVFPAIPSWVIRKLVKPQKRNIAFVPPRDCDIGGLAKFVSRAGKGERNNCLYWAAQRAKEEGQSYQATLQELKPAALSCGLAQEEIIRTIRSAYQC